jgi:hypothetical protein
MWNKAISLFNIRSESKYNKTEHLSNKKKSNWSSRPELLTDTASRMIQGWKVIAILIYFDNFSTKYRG